MLLASLFGLVAAQSMTDRSTTLPDSAKCDDAEKAGTSKANGWIAGDTCMSASRTAEDDWFRDNVCPKYKFACLDGETPAECKKLNDEQCEAMRAQWLGNIGLLPRVEIDSSATRVKNSALDVVTLLNTKSWFDNETPLADFAKASTSSSCSYRPSDWQEEDEFIALKNDKTPLATTCGVSLPADFRAYPQTVAGVLSYLLDTVFEEFSPTGSEYAGTSRHATRKDIRTLSNDDRIRYLEALAKTECLGLTKIWGAIHASSPADMHSGPGFLPSHSVFMRIYELSLQRFGDLGEDIALHIGGWTADNTLPRWHNGRIRYSAIWGNDFIGPIANQYIGSEQLKRSSTTFARRVPWATPSDQAEIKVLTRNFRQVEQRGGYISPQDVWNAMSVDDPMQFSCLVEQSILHGGHHMVISGHMGNLLAASWDAAFFMHHGFVDCLFRNWQMQGDDKNDRAAASKFPQVSSRWTRHKPTDYAHWLKWTSPVDNKVKTITHAMAYEYRQSGRGSYKCVIPSLLPCRTDEDCGVPSGTRREDKRLYCSVSQVCSQYIETNAICRNEYGSFLPCQKTTDRCQYSPKLYAKENSGRAPTSDAVVDAWYCVESPALKCGANLNAATCGGAAGCMWVDESKGVKKCPQTVPSFGFGVFESAAQTLQPMGAQFDFKSAPFDASVNAKSWSITNKDVTATVKPKQYILKGGKIVDNAKYKLYRDRSGFGVDEEGAQTGASCSPTTLASKGDFSNQIDRSEALEISFNKEVILQSLDLGLWSNANDKVDIEIYNKDKLIAIQRFDTNTVVFGVSSGDAVSDCPMNVCKATRIVLYHLAANEPAKSSVVGKMSGTRCLAQFVGAGFSVDSLTVAVAGETSAPANAQASTFNGYCTGNPDSTGDYEFCVNEDTCYISPPSNEDGFETNVDIVLVPAGMCGPKGWIPQITFTEATIGGKKALKAKYVSQCSCGVTGQAPLKGSGPKAGVDPSKYRPLFDLYRVQDRLNGNDDAKKEDGIFVTSAAATPFVALLTSVLVLLAML